ncbi:MAG TPA: MFS transporter [Candidatus Paceibacterota bacterium]|nr:MFS transporter [Candidatus Paceibacterota bacterium]
MIFKGERIFWAISLQVAVLNFYLGGFGPAQSLLRAQQHTSLAIAGLHGTAMGIASIIAGLMGPRIVHRVGRATTSWLGMAIFCTGVFIFVISPPIQLTLFATLISGFGTSIVINVMVTQLSHHYSRDASKAISQSSGIGSIGYILGTLTSGMIAGTSFSWRLGLLAVIPASVILYLLTHRAMAAEHIPDPVGHQRGSLNSKFWISWVGFIACISSEFAITFWSAALLRERLGSSAAISTISIMAIGTGMGIGRWFGPHLLRRYALDKKLLTAMIIQLVGFAALWSSHILWFSLISLFAVGVGLSMQFALASLRLIRFSEDRPDLAIGKSSLAAGLAIAGAPFLLGVLGDHLGISRAFLLVPVLIIVAMASVVAIPSDQSIGQETIGQDKK